MSCENSHGVALATTVIMLSILKTSAHLGKSFLCFSFLFLYSAKTMKSPVCRGDDLCGTAAVCCSDLVPVWHRQKCLQHSKLLQSSSCFVLILILSVRQDALSGCRWIG